MAQAESPSRDESAVVGVRSRPDWFLWAGLAVALMMRAEAFVRPLMPDESGFIVVGRHWHPNADSMYGSLWVDRPPLLIGAVHAFDVLGGKYAPRVLAGLLVLLFVLAAYHCGRLLGGRSSARWSCAAAIALSAQPEVTTFSAKSESLGVPVVMTSCWLILEALQRPAGAARARSAFAAGFVGALAVGMKQNLLGAAVFGLVLVGLTLRARLVERRDALRFTAWGAAGFALPVIVTLIWALQSGVRIHSVWYALYGFRAQALDVILAGPLGPTLHRLLVLIALAVLSGLAFLIVCFWVRLRDVLRVRKEVALAVLAMMLFDGVGLLLSGSYWGSNLTALYPSAVLAVGLLVAVPATLTPRIARGLVCAAVVSALVSVGIWVPRMLTGGRPLATYVGSRIGEAAAPGDTIVVLYGSANIVLASGLATPYEHLWSLPMRTLDPDLRELAGVLAGPAAPTWVVPWQSPNAWGIDESGRIRTLLKERYRPAARLCGHTVLLRAGVQRPALRPINCHHP